MTDTFRKLCAELVDDLEPWVVYGEIEAIEKSHDLIARARAALAAEPEPPKRNFVGGYQPRPSIGTHNPPPKNP
jgi:hypothetical protein